MLTPPPVRLPDEEWEKRYKSNAAKQNKRRHQAKIYLKNNYLEKLTCKNCYAFGYVSVCEIKNKTVRLFCVKCKNSRLIRVALPKNFLPKKFNKLIE